MRLFTFDSFALLIVVRSHALLLLKTVKSLLRSGLIVQIGQIIKYVCHTEVKSTWQKGMIGIRKSPDVRYMLTNTGILIKSSLSGLTEFEDYTRRTLVINLDFRPKISFAHRKIASLMLKRLKLSK